MHLFDHVDNIIIGNANTGSIYYTKCPKNKTQCASDNNQVPFFPAQMTRLCNSSCTYRGRCDKWFTCLHQYVEIDYFCLGISMTLVIKLLIFKPTKQTQIPSTLKRSFGIPGIL